MTDTLKSTRGLNDPLTPHAKKSSASSLILGFLVVVAAVAAVLFWTRLNETKQKLADSEA